MDTEEPQQQPHPQLEQGLSGMASEIDREAKSLTPPMPGPAATGSKLAYTDRWGREFDPALHVAKDNGEPALYKGRTLIVKPGQRPTGAPVRAAAPAPARSFLATPEEGAPGQAGEIPQQAPAPAPQLPPVTPERLAADSRLLTTLWKRVGQLLGGADVAYQDTEAVNIHDTALLWRQEVNQPLPVGALGLHLVEVSMFLARVAATPEGRRNLRELTGSRSFFSGPAPDLRPPATAKREEAPRPDAPAPGVKRGDLATALTEA